MVECKHKKLSAAANRMSGPCKHLQDSMQTQREEPEAERNQTCSVAVGLHVFDAFDASISTCTYFYCRMC